MRARPRRSSSCAPEPRRLGETPSRTAQHGIFDVVEHVRVVHPAEALWMCEGRAGCPPQAGHRSIDEGWTVSDGAVHNELDMARSSAGQAPD